MVQQLIQDFIDRYLPREDVMRRLPLDLSIQTFWPQLQAVRRALGHDLPLSDQSGTAFWFVPSPAIKRQVDIISASARREQLLSPMLLEDLQAEAVIEEAVYSSMIEGAFTTRQEAERLLKSGREPASKSEQMVKNNYDALTHILEHLEEEISSDFIIRIAGILTRNASEEPVTTYRQGQVVVAGRDEIIYTPPEAGAVPVMMDSLLLFIRHSSLHPVLTASIAHFYFVYVHPFSDGNGRTARALSLMILLQAGYDLFRTFPISGIVAKERGKYYKAIKNAEEAQGDLTYFIDFFSDMLSRSVLETEHRIRYQLLAEQRMQALKAKGLLNERQLKGADWLLRSENEQITVAVWQKKFRIATETARQDLLLLSQMGLLKRRLDGRRAVFELVRE